MSMSFPLSLPSTYSVMNQAPATDATTSSTQPTSGRNPRALDVIYITSTEGFLHDISQNLKKKAEKSKVPMEILYVENLKGSDREEKISDFKNYLKDFHEDGRIDEKTQIIIHIHGSVNDHPHELSNQKNDFSIATMEMVSLIRNSKISTEESLHSESWNGTIHIGACGAARAGSQLKEDAGMNLLYAGKKIKLGIDSEAIFSEVIRQLGEYRKDVQKNSFPTVQEFYNATEKVSGEKITLSGKGTLCHTRSTYLPLPAELVRQEVVDKLEKSLAAKLMHGKISTVKNITELLGPFVKGIKFSNPLGLIASVGGNDVEEKLKILIEAGVDINERFYKGNNALHLAVEKGKKQEALLLIKYGVNINEKNKIGETPLSIAIGSSNIEMIECLINAGADVYAEDRDGNSALHIACSKGRKDLVEMLLGKGISAFAGNNEGHSALQNAISVQDYQMVDLILTESPQIKFSDMDPNGTALFFSISEKFPKFLQKMLRKIPDKKSALGNYFDALTKEITENNESRMFDLRMFARHKTMLRDLTREILLDSNNRMPDYFRDYLMSFMSVRYEEYLPAILASPNLGEKWQADLEMLGEVSNHMGRNGVSNLFYAAVALKSKLSERIDPDLFQLYDVDEGGLTRSQRACRDGNIAELMILDNVSSNDKFSITPDGKSTLMLACESGSEEVVIWLLDNGVDRDLRDVNGKTALDYATEMGNEGIKRAIQNHFTFFSPIELN
jgi:ankyrin repeat protein